MSSRGMQGPCGRQILRSISLAGNHQRKRGCRSAMCGIRPWRAGWKKSSPIVIGTHGRVTARGMNQLTQDLACEQAEFAAASEIMYGVHEWRLPHGQWQWQEAGSHVGSWFPISTPPGPTKLTTRYTVFVRCGREPN